MEKKGNNYEVAERACGSNWERNKGSTEKQL